MRSAVLCPLALILLGSGTAFPSDNGRIHGELTCDSCRSYSNVVVDVYDSNRRPMGTYTVTSAGDFDMIGVADGVYTMTVRGANGMEITSQTVSVQGETGSVSIRLPDSSSDTEPTSKQAAVSMYQLSHKVPKAARKEFERAAAAGENNDKVVAHLNKAIEIDPDYVEALNNLGSRYIQMNQLDRAMEVLDRAGKLDSASAQVQTNIAVALLSMHKLADAERAARRAFQLASNDPRARYILALSLYTRQEFTPETEKLLQASRDSFPNANIALGYMYATQGKNTEARVVLTGYLTAGHTARELQVRKLLSMLPKQ